MNLLIRADASTEIGTGHIMRCLALAQAWQDLGGAVCFASAVLPDGLAARLTAEGMSQRSVHGLPGSQEDATEVVRFANELGADWIVIDGYQFDSQYQYTIKNADIQLLVIDDYGHAPYYAADLVLNHNIYADDSLYPHHESTTHFLLGHQYVLLRREFWHWYGWHRYVPEKARNVLIMMGGSDPDNVTLKIIQALQEIELPTMKVLAVMGASNPHVGSVQAEIHGSPHDIRLKRNVLDIAMLMSQADIAISASGSTSWELAFMRLPSLFTSIADNQVSTATELARRNCAVNLGWHAELTAPQIVDALSDLISNRQKRIRISEKGRELIDGLGVFRVVQLVKNSGLVLREANVSDCRLIWEWANDSETRLASFSSGLIAWEEHKRWFESKLTDPQSVLFIAENELGIPVGHVRFQIEEDEAVISVNISPEHRRRGYGWRVIQLGSQLVSRLFPLSTLHAYIKLENVASIRSFSKAEYVKNDTVQIDGYQALHFSWRT